LVAVGHDSPLSAVSALIWDVLRVVDKGDSDNPILGIEDGVALSPQPGFLSCWPSLYKVLCEVVLENGMPEMGATTGGEPASCLLLSNLRPLLESSWHANFDETTLGFRNEDGTLVKLKKLKHLLTAVLRWRDQRVAWQKTIGARRSAIDDILAPVLDLVPSTKHNDLVLRYSTGAFASASPSTSTLAKARVPERKEEQTVRKSSSLKSELERLRAENEALREKNDSLQMMAAPVPQLHDIFDDPYEPPPEVCRWGSATSSTFSRTSSADMESVGSRIDFRACSQTGSISSWQSSCASANVSGVATPTHSGHMEQRCAFVPVWVPFNHVMQSTSACFVDVSVIPSGIVQTARQHFERVGERLLK